MVTILAVADAPVILIVTVAEIWGCVLSLLAKSSL